MNSFKTTRRKGAALKLGALTSTALVGLILSPSAYAQRQWSGGVSTDWFDPLNWNPTAVPNVGVDATIDDMTFQTPTITGVNKTAVAENIIIGNAKSATLNVEGGATLKTQQAALGYLAGSNGVVNIGILPSASLTHWTNTGSLAVGRLGAATLNIGKGTVSNASAIIGIGYASDGLVAVAGPSASWTNNGNLMVSMYGTANLILASGGKVSSTSGTVGGYLGGKGTVLVTGADSVWTAGTQLVVGDAGTGILTINDQGEVISDSAVIGNKVNGTGEATVDGVGSKWSISGDLTIGNGGTGTLTISNGGAVKNVNGNIGNAGPGTVTISGAGSKWWNLGDLNVGGAGKGTLSITAGGAVENEGIVHVGADTGTGSILVDGAGSHLQGSGNTVLVVGEFGTGAVSISNGGKVSTSGGILGEREGSSGAVTIDGAASTWGSSGDLYIGRSGSGVFEVRNGANLTSGASYAGLDAKGTGTITVTGAGTTWDATSIGIGVAGTGTLNILNGGVVTDNFLNQQRVLGMLAGSHGTANVDGAGSAWNTGADFSVGGSGTGSLNVIGGGTVTNHSGYVGNTAEGVGTATIDGAGSSWTNSASLYVGSDGAGTLNVTHGGVVNATFTAFGSSAGAIGIGTIDGKDSALVATGNLTVGSFGTGTMTVSNGGSVSNLAGTISGAAGASGSVTVEGAGSKWANDGDLAIGTGGTATLSILNGGAVSNKLGMMGFQADATGSATVDGIDSSWTNSAGVYVGVFGQGSLAISNGGVVNATGGHNVIGTQAGSSGVVTIDGAGSLWTSGMRLSVGNIGTGSLTITNGGSAHADLGIIANSVGSSGIAIIDGAGSSWTNSTDLSVGRLGTGELKLVNGGTATSMNGFVGQYAGSRGSVSVEGAGSAWNGSGDMSVGAAGNGSLTIASGGSVSLGGKLVLAEKAGSTGALNIGADAGSPATGAGTLAATALQFGSGTGVVSFNHNSANYAFALAMSGDGTLNQLAGVTSLTGNSGGFSGMTHVSGGTLLVDGMLGNGALDVQSGGTLGGAGTIGGAVTIAAGGTLAGYQGQALTMGGLSFANGAKLDVALSTPGGGTLFDVSGDLTLDGTLNIAASGQFGAGVYRLINYGGMLTDNGLDIGASPDGTTAADFLVQTSVAGQVNLVNSALPSMLFWDGDLAGSAGNNLVDGGSGVWNNASANWTDANGATNGVMHPQPGFAIFQGMGGTVTVDAGAGDVAVTGMQFAGDGYTLIGAPIALTKVNSSIRVGDGSAAGADYKATIETTLTGAGGLVKTDLGTLILTGTNDYTGGTTITDGVLQLGNGGTTGSVAGNIVNNGTLVFDRADGSIFAGQISGGGLLVQKGTGKTNLTGDSGAFTGEVHVDGGALAVIGGGKLNAGLISVASDPGSVADLQLDGAGSALTGLALAVGGEGAGSVTIGNGATVTLGEATLANSSGSTGTLVVDGAGSKLASDSLYVGVAASGVLTIGNGGAVTSQAGHVGYYGGSDGAVSVKGAGSRWTTTTLDIGQGGTGWFNVLNGGVVTSSSAVVGASVGGTGYANVNGAGAAWVNTGDLRVGMAGNGHLAAGNGGTITSANAYVGFAAGATGSATVNGAGSSWASSGNLYLGASGAGTLTVGSGGTVTNDSAALGVVAGASGSAVIDGAGSSWKSAGSLTIGGDGTGKLVVSNGALVTGNVAYLGYGAGSTGTASVTGSGSTLNSTLGIAVGVNGTASLAIANGGQVKGVDAAIASAAGAKGSVTVDGAGSAWSASGQLSVGDAGTGTLAITRGGMVSNAAGSVGYAAGSSGVVTVDGAGSTWTSSGQLVLGQSGSAVVTIANGATVSVGGPLGLAMTAGSSGVVNIGAASGSPAVAAGTLNAGMLQFGAGNGVLNFNHTSTGYTFATAMAGAGTINQLAGMTNLTGNSSGFTGLVNVLGGKLAMNGSLAGGKVTVGAGATLGGNGTIASLTAQSGAIIAPGNSIGTISILGNASFAAGSVYQVELNGAGQSDLIKVSGTAVIGNGALLSITKLDATPYTLGTRYTLLTADGGVTGAFAFNNVQLTNFIGLVGGADAKSLFIDVAKTKSFVSAAQTGNQKAVATAIDGLPLAATLTGAVASLMSDAAAQGAFDQLSGDIHASARKVLVEDSRFVREAALNRLYTAFDGERFAAWGRGYGAWGHSSGNGNAAGIGSDVGGFLIGVDAPVGEHVRIGAVSGYGRSTFRIAARNASGTSDNYDLAIYAGGKWGNLGVRAGAAYGWHSLAIDRRIGFDGFADSLSSAYDARTAQAFGELGYGITTGKVEFQPFASLAYVDLSTDGFAEKGGAAALAGKKGNSAVTFTTLGTRVSSAFSLGETSLTVHGLAGWRHAFDNTSRSVLTLSGSAPFGVIGVPVARDAGLVDLGIDMAVARGTTLGLSYGGQFGGGTREQTVRAALSFKF